MRGNHAKNYRIGLSVYFIIGLIEPRHEQLSLERQCELVGLPRSSWYYEAVPDNPEDLRIMRLLDEQYTRTPFYGVEKMTAWLHTIEEWE